MLHLGQSLLACGLVTGAIGCTRTRHGLLHSLNRLRRYFAHPFLNGSHRARCRLSTHSDHGARRSRRPGSSCCFNLSVDLCLHAAYFVCAGARIDGCHRCGRCCDYYHQPLNVHDHLSRKQRHYLEPLRGGARVKCSHPTARLGGPCTTFRVAVATPSNPTFDKSSLSTKASITRTGLIVPSRIPASGSPSSSRRNCFRISHKPIRSPPAATAARG